MIRVSEIANDISEVANDSTASGTVVGFDHLQLSMPVKPEAGTEADKFYGEMLGLRSLTPPGPVVARGGRWYRAGQVSVHLVGEDPFRPARGSHPGLLVDDVGALSNRLAGVGIACTVDDSLPGVRRAYVDDPFGNRLELVEPPGTPVVLS